MRRNAKCCYDPRRHHCGLTAARSVNQKPYCATHADIVERALYDQESHNDILNKMENS